VNAYRVHCLCRRVLHDEAFRRDILADPEAAMAAMPLDADAREALLAGDVARLYRGGAHPFLLLILSRFGVFGLDLPTFNARIRTGSPDLRGGLGAPSAEADAGPARARGAGQGHGSARHDATEIEG
jgi:hypothetical protein